VVTDEDRLNFFQKKLDETKKVLFQAGTVMEVKRLQNKIAFFNEKISELKKSSKN